MAKQLVFQPDHVQRHDDKELPRSGAGGDDRDGKVYVYHRDDIALAVNVALATRRPLLLSGPSGCGKSTLALNVALSLGWRYYEYVVTARSEARDLLWGFDSLRRLNDAQVRERDLAPDEEYVEAGVLWWAFDAASADGLGMKDPSPVEGERAVVLIDEIDKADPDMPNNLLVPLGSLQFRVKPTGFEVTGSEPPLIFITTNGERELPRAFIRRCVALDLPAPKAENLVEIGRALIPEDEHDEELFKRLADHVVKLAEDDKDDVAPSTAEYLDTLRACLALGIDTEHESFEDLSRITLRKTPTPDREPWA